jgi:hypothetical protein
VLRRQAIVAAALVALTLFIAGDQATNTAQVTADTIIV